MNTTTEIRRGAQSINALTVRRRLGRKEWLRPQMYGPDGWAFQRKDYLASVIISVANHDGVEWVHASMAGRDHEPGYYELRLLYQAVFGTGWAYQVFAPPEAHVNLHEHALHLWGRLDGQPALPDFSGVIAGKRSI